MKVNANANANVFVPVEWVVKFVIFAFNGPEFACFGVFSSTGIV